MGTSTYTATTVTEPNILTPVGGYVSNGMPQNTNEDTRTKDRAPVTYMALLYKNYWLSGELMPSIQTYTGEVNRLIEGMAWQDSPIPRWNDYLSNIINYESRYGVKSQDLYDAYRNGTVSKLNIPHDILEDWLRQYRLYTF
jgi:hypothetical protein